MRVRPLETPLCINSHEMPWSRHKESDCQDQCLPEELGNGRSRVFTLDPDFSLIDTQYSPSRNFVVTTRMSNQEPRMVLTLALKGSSQYCDNQRNEVLFKSGYTTLTTFHSSDGLRSYKGDQAVAQLRFSMTRSWLECHFGEGVFAQFFNEQNVQLVRQRPISAAAIQTVQCMLDNSVQMTTQPLFRRGLAMAIVSSELNDLFNEARSQSHGITPRDRRLVESAREILHAEFADPPTIEELCLRVNTNEFKLKRLFRSCFDTTPYGMLLDIRMHKAYRLLTTNRYSVSTAAEAVGYSHASNFSTAFTKYFGFPPKYVFRKV